MIVSPKFKLTDVQFEELWKKFIALDAANNNGKESINFLGSANSYKKLLKQAATSFQ